MKIPCSSCNQRLEIPEELAGQTIECPACNATLAVPAMAAPPPLVEVTTPQAAKPQKPAPQRKTAGQPKAASSKKSKSPIPKWVIAAVAGVVIVVLMLVIFNGSKPKAPAISIHDAAFDGNIEAVKQHLAAGTDINAKYQNNKTDESIYLKGLGDEGETPLHPAAYGDNKNIVELLIAKGADVNAKNKDGWTPLHWAAAMSHKEVAELLLANGADVNAKDEDGQTPLDNAMLGNDKDTADLLRKHGGKHGTIDVAALDGDIEAVKEFLAAGVDVNAKNRYGRTALHHAGGKEVAELLIAKGADVNTKDVDGKTPLDWAIINNNPETANLLRKHGGKTGEELKAESK
jgi:ankyrin repeat protein